MGKLLLRSYPYTHCLVFSYLSLRDIRRRTKNYGKELSEMSLVEMKNYWQENKQ